MVQKVRKQCRFKPLRSTTSLLSNPIVLLAVSQLLTRRGWQVFPYDGREIVLVVIWMCSEAVVYQEENFCSSNLLEHYQRHLLDHHLWKNSSWKRVIKGFGVFFCHNVFTVPVTWNALQVTVHLCQSFAMFCSALKAELINKAYSYQPHCDRLL